MIELLESRGMVTYVCKGAPRMAKVSLRMDEDEVGMAFGDKAMLGAIIDDVTCICKWVVWLKNIYNFVWYGKYVHLWQTQHLHLVNIDGGYLMEFKHSLQSYISVPGYALMQL